MLEQTILSNLLFNEDYYKKVYPFIKTEYFDEESSRRIFDSYTEYVEKYKQPPSTEALKISIDNQKDINEESFKNIIQTIDLLKIDPTTKLDWLVDQTEKFCQDKDLYNSIRKAILILDGKEKQLDKGAIPKLLSDSLGISFDTNVGHDLTEDVESRYEYYHRKQERLDLDLDIFNKITKGGFPRKSMTVLLATSGGGKSLCKCHIAAQQLLYGRNVLYITMELAEEEVARRIDANVMDLTIDEVRELPLHTFQKKMSRVKEKTTGKLIIKEYPTGSAHVGHFRHLLNELRLKKNFVPDIVMIDYLNICASSRIKGAAAANSYTLVKSIAEEVRGLAMEHDFAVLTSSQYNRQGYQNTNIDLTNTSESMGIVFTADAIFALVTTEELDNLGQLMVTQLKNRWGDINYYKRFVIGIDRSRMKLYDLEETAQNNIQNEPVLTKPKANDGESVFDKSSFAEQWSENKSTYTKKKMFKSGEVT